MRRCLPASTRQCRPVVDRVMTRADNAAWPGPIGQPCESCHLPVACARSMNEDFGMELSERIPIRVPEVGLEPECEVQVSMWFARPGELVLEGDRLVELLAEDVTFDVTAPVTGRVVEILRDVDEPVEPGETIGWLEASVEDAW